MLNRFDNKNVPRFKNGKNNGYICSFCEKKTSLDDSCSHQGYNLHCMLCVYRFARTFDKSVGEIVMKIQTVGRIRQVEYEKGE